MALSMLEQDPYIPHIPSTSGGLYQYLGETLGIVGALHLDSLSFQ